MSTRQIVSARMRARAIATTLVATAALVGLALPAGAGATKSYKETAEVSATLAGTSTNGFHFALFAFDRAEIFALYKLLPEEGDESVAYVAFHHTQAGIDRGRLDVKLGKLGHFRGHLVAISTKVQKLRKGCTGEPTTVEEGHFVGSFVFHGERGYTTIDAPRELGSITRGGATECQIRASKPGKHHRHANDPKAEKRTEEAAERDETRLLAGDAKADLLLRASREQDPPEPDAGAATAFEVTARGKAAGFDVIRSVSIASTGREAAARFFAVPNLAEPQAEVTLEPPAPFSGSAAFHLEGPTKASWTGDLAVELPGLAELPLTGKKIYAGVCRGQSNCTKTLPIPLSELAKFEGGGGDGEFAVAVVQGAS
jgi:hypothetical protein